MNTYFLGITKSGLIITSIVITSFILSMFVGYTCPFHAIFGIQCPGCGMTRAMKFLLVGNFYEAMRANPTFPLMPILFWGILRGGVIVKNDWFNGFLWSFVCVGIGILFVVRNW